MSNLQNSSLDIQDYLDATADASRRTRAVSYSLVVASVLIFSALLNSLHGHWMSRRLDELNHVDSNYVVNLVGKRPSGTTAGYAPKNIEEWAWGERYKHLHVNMIRSYIDNAFVVRVPFFGITFDVNDLGPVGGIAFVILLLTLRFCLTREGDNLRLAFREAALLGRLNEFYRLLAMSQVLTVPLGTTVKRSKLLKWSPKCFIALPLLVHVMVVVNDVRTRFLGAELVGPRVFAFLLIEVSMLVVIAIHTDMAVLRLQIIDVVWDKAWVLVRHPGVNDVLSLFDQAYEELRVARRLFDDESIQSVRDDNADLYYDRFWHLQVEQFDAWKKGLIDDDTYWFWMSVRRTEWRANEAICGRSFQYGWYRAVVRLSLVDKSFENHMKIAMVRGNFVLEWIDRSRKNRCGQKIKLSRF